MKGIRLSRRGGGLRRFRRRVANLISFMKHENNGLIDLRSVKDKYYLSFDISDLF